MDIKAIISVLAMWMFLPILLTVIIAFFRLRELSRSQYWIFILTCIALVTQIVSSIMWYLQINNLALLHLYTVVELLVIVEFFKSINSNAKIRQRLTFIQFVFCFIAVANVLFYQSIFEMNSIVRGLESLIVIGLSFQFWIKIMRELKIEKLTDSPIFWFNTAFLVYFSVNFILFIFSSDLNKLSVEKVIQPWLFHDFFMVIYYLLLAIGLWKRQHQ